MLVGFGYIVAAGDNRSSGCVVDIVAGKSINWNSLGSVAGMVC